MTRILIADAHDVIRLGIRQLIESCSESKVCAEATTGMDAVGKAAALQPDLVTLDVTMPDMNGLEMAGRIRRAAPMTRLLVVTRDNTEQLVHDFVEAGVRGYVLKSDSGRTLIDAIDTILRGRTFFSERLRPVPDAVETPGHAATHVSGREREVLRLLAEGHSNKTIGVMLGISTKTAETHRTRLMAKLGMHSIVELVRYAIRNHVVEV